MLAYGRKSGRGSYGPNFLKWNIKLGGRIIQMEKSLENKVFWNTKIIEVDTQSGNYNVNVVEYEK